MMVISVKNVDDLFCPVTFRYEMENKPVHRIFEERPNKTSKNEKQADLPGWLPKTDCRII
jgi:hypothetical protein